MTTELKLTKKDFVSDQMVRWCPGCGDYSILNAVQQTFPELGIPKEKFVVVSGIGCSSRFPYYMDTYGFHSLHGRAPAIATGIKLANPDLSVWIATGDGDALSIGGNHIIHLLRRNVDIKIMMFDNRIYGLTKGQYSPTSETGKRTKSTPYGSLDRPFRALELALGAQATFVARAIDTYGAHLKEVLKAASDHKGASFMQIYQNCNIFNDGAFEQYRDKKVRDDNLLELRHGEPLIFGKDRDKGIRTTDCYQPEVVQLGNGITEKDLLVHDEDGPLGYLYMLANLEPPDFPAPIGVLRKTKAPCFAAAAHEQMDYVKEKEGEGDLEQLLKSGGTWVVE
ncbi:MAG: 2-oxoacid:ferredoxin oxidoreductase subunit beta [Acidobacteria bacterium]|uniref:2-oxoacid:ferredoxin oxidoreductase subunit beta n=1 Tax=Candidatus Polarisedimenticola svalbardensis TaxID=2886004 RepID=A0A8J7CKD9_9BACT|nr:2-oxoacid:ferredoxin oxidoreductase subunit beta [Candidatus Polarisedimenticola svalbardensis]